MALNSLKNYYDQFLDDNQSTVTTDTGLVLSTNQIPNTNDPSNNNAAKYGQGAPLLPFPIGNTFSPGSLLDDSPINDIVPGGILGGIEEGIKDSLLITRFLAGTPEGLKFSLSQVGLQAMSPELENRQVLGSSYTRLYTPLNTLSQVGLNALSDTGFDMHIPRVGALPRFVDNDNDKYWNIVKEKSIDPANLEPFNEIVNRENPASGSGSTFGSYAEVARSGVFGSNTNRLLDLYQGQILGISARIAGVGEEISQISYMGGPDSFFGIGRTSIKKAENTTFSDSNFIDPTTGKNVLENIPLITAPAISDSLRTIEDLKAVGLDIYNRGIEDKGANPPSDLIAGMSNPVDRITHRSLFRGISDYSGVAKKPTLLDGTALDEEYDEKLKDLVQFRFEAIDNDKPVESIFIVFRALLTDISDNFNAEWNGSRYVGRGEKMWVYEGFDRTITFNFNVLAQSRAELKPMIQKMNFLQSNLTPDYNEAGRMRGPLMKLTIGDYFVAVPGFITSLSTTIDSDTTWDIGLYKKGKVNSEDIDADFQDSERELPHLLRVSVNYTPIHSFLPRKSVNESPYIMGLNDPWIRNADQ